jgi:hypothetical protein
MSSKHYPFVYFSPHVAALHRAVRRRSRQEVYILREHSWLDMSDQRTNLRRTLFIPPEPPPEEPVTIFGFDDWTSIEDSVFS